jgi:cytochrome b pre-mRNA-processing protein 3
MFSLFKKQDAAITVSAKDAAYNLYMLATRWARSQELYTKYQVPDTLEGRFDLLVLHVSMILDRLEITEDKKHAQKIGQYLFEIFIQNMDQSLREKGVGDMGVPRRMRAMIEGFNGRHSRYRLIFTKWHEGKFDESIAELKTALSKNVYYKPENELQPHLTWLAAYVESMIGTLADKDDLVFLNGDSAQIEQVEM